MGKIIRNGIEFSGTRDTANNINYDNTLSGLNAATAQEAIDELSADLGKDENGMTLHEKLDELLSKEGSSSFTTMSTLKQGNTDSTAKVTLCNYTFANKPNFLAILNWHTGNNIGYLSYKINDGEEINLGEQSGNLVKILFMNNVNINANDTITLYASVDNRSGSFMAQLVDFK